MLVFLLPPVVVPPAQGDRRKAQVEAAAGGYESESLKAVSRIEYELRSFAQGARDALDQLGQLVYNRALLDARLAVTTAEYLLRRGARPLAAAASGRPTERSPSGG